MEIDEKAASLPGHRVKALLDLPIPTPPRGLQLFLGAVIFYRRFLKDFANIAKPLYTAARLTPTTKTRSWEPAVLDSFQRVKSALARQTQLFHPNSKALIAITMDTTVVAMEAVLEQFEDNAWQPLAFFSRAWKPPQMRYAAYDKELVAIVEAIKYFRYYIEGAKFIVFTDHLPIVRGFKKAATPLSHMQQRHFAFVSEFTNDIRHLPGKNNLMADLLSRHNGDVEAQQEARAPQLAVVPQLTVVEKPTEPGRRDVVNYHSSIDQDLLRRIGVEQGNDQQVQDLVRKSPERFQTRSCAGHVLVGDVREGFRLYVPQSLRSEIFKQVHAQGHPGARQTKLDLARFFVWQNIDREVKALVRSCIACQKTKTTTHDKQPLQHFPLPEARFEHLHIDVVGPTTGRGNVRYMLMVVDQYSRFPTAIPMQSENATTIVNLLVDRWIALFGVPLVITTDRGTVFTSERFQHFLREHAIRWQPTTSYHPQSNGLVERFHRRLKDALTAMGGHWPEKLLWVLLSIRNANGSDIPFSPSQALFGVKVRPPKAIAEEADPMPLLDFIQKRVDFGAPQTIQGRWHARAGETTETGRSLQGIDWVLIKRGQKSPLQFAYAGPFRMIAFTDKHVTIQYHGKEVIVSRDRVKPIDTKGLPFIFPCDDDVNFFLNEDMSDSS